MSRSLHRKDRRDWENVLIAQIQCHAAPLNKMRNYDLADEDLTVNRWIIEACYGSFRAAIGPISAAKTLHLIAPNYFPLWDTDMAELARNNARPCKNLVTGPRLSSHEYYGYIQQIQHFLLAYRTTWDQLASEFNRSKLKMIDAYLWDNDKPDAWLSGDTSSSGSIR